MESSSSFLVWGVDFCSSWDHGLLADVRLERVARQLFSHALVVPNLGSVFYASKGVPDKSDILVWLSASDVLSSAPQ